MRKTMRAGRLRLEPRRCAVEEVPVPGPGEVLVAVKAAGVCLSNVHLTDGSLSPTFSRTGAVTLGHEVAGATAALGPGVTDITDSIAFTVRGHQIRRERMTDLQAVPRAVLEVNGAARRREELS